MKYKGYTAPTGSEAAFADEVQISTWAFDAVKEIQRMGIVSGRPGNLYDPKATATRAEVATIFARFRGGTGEVAPWFISATISQKRVCQVRPAEAHLT